MKKEEKSKTEKIALLNDACRQSVMIPVFGKSPGEIFYTRGISSLSPFAQVEIAAMVRNFVDFNDGNNPYGERDFGSFKYEGKTIFWKIDYYDLDMKYGSSDPTNPDITTRVLTIMLAREY